MRAETRRVVPSVEEKGTGREGDIYSEAEQDITGKGVQIEICQVWNRQRVNITPEGRL